MDPFLEKKKEYQLSLASLVSATKHEKMISISFSK